MGKGWCLDLGILNVVVIVLGFFYVVVGFESVIFVILNWGKC